jgi:hypothetical protein
VTNYNRRFSVGQSGDMKHYDTFGPPPPGSQSARRLGCTCGLEEDNGECPLHHKERESVKGNLHG